VEPSLLFGPKQRMGKSKRSESEATAEGSSDSETIAELVSEDTIEDGGLSISESELLEAEWMW
jgi:hypothetical protein